MAGRPSESRQPSRDPKGKHQPEKGPPSKQPQDKPAPGLEVACRQHLDFVRKNCPGMLPAGPVDPGTPTEPVPVDPRQATDLFRAAMATAVATATGGRPSDPPTNAVVWTQGADSLLVILDSVTVSTDEGVVTVGIYVACDQLSAEVGESRAQVDIDLVIGSARRTTGLLAAAPMPRGPAIVVDRWHDALVALAWQALLDVAAGLSASAGSDIDGTGLVPTRWTASKEGLAIGPQARHPFDRVPADSRNASHSLLSPSG